MRDERDADAEIYRACTSNGRPFSAGYQDEFGRILAHDYPQNEWRKEIERQRPWIAAVLQRFEGLDVETAHRKAATIATFAEMRAMDFLEERIEKEASLERQVGAAQGKPVNGPKVTVEKFSSVIHRLLDEIDSPAPALPTPFPTLNYALFGGPRRGELIYLAARPGIGKSALAVGMALHAAERGNAVLIASREMSNIAQARRMLAQFGKLPAGDLRLGKRVDWQKITETVDRMYQLPIYLTEDAYRVDQIEAAARSIENLKFVVVDYLQLLDAPNTRDARARVESVSVSLKRLAMRLSVPVLALSSVTRPQGRSEDERPTLASLRESGNLEHDADVVLILHRKRDGVETECHVEKNREGQSGVCVHLTFRPEWVSFDELSTDVFDEGRRYGQ